MSGIADLILGPREQRDQRLRIRRFFMALGSYAMWFLLSLAGAWIGLFDISVSFFGPIAIALLLTNLIVYAVFRSGYNLRFVDPSLTLHQLVLALLWVLMLMAVTVEVRGLMMLVYLVTMLFGIFHLSKREFIAVAGFAFLMFVALIVVEELVFPDRRPADQQLLTVMVLGGLLAWTVMFGSYVSDLRHRLVERNLALEEALAKIQELAIRDDLTGIFNRRHILQSLEQLKARADRYNQGFSICLIDLDRFKNINDRFGHAAGDEVLKRFAATARDTLRGLDTMGLKDMEPEAGRYGGEEFLLALPDTDLEGAQRAAERLLQQVREMSLADDLPPIRVTFSAGVASYQRREPIQDLLARADAALYRAKDGGRDRIVAARSS